MPASGPVLPQDPFKNKKPELQTYLMKVLIEKLQAFIATRLASWKTTALGVSIVAKEISNLLNGDQFDWEVLVAGVGLLFAKDGDKTNSASPIPVARKVD